MFWASLAKTSLPGGPCTHNLTAAPTDRVIRLPSPLGRASDHRNRQAEFRFRTDDHSRINLQRHKRYRVHVRVSRTKNLFPLFPFINSRETPTGTGTRRRSGPAV